MRHILLVSGKDSLATAIVQTRREPDLPYELVHNPTGWDLPETEIWLHNVADYLGLDLIMVGDDLTELTKEQGILPTAMARFCTRLAKIKPLQEYLGTSKSICYYGLRADEHERVGYVQSKNDPIQPCYPLREVGMGLVEVWQLCESVGLLPPQFRWAWLETRVRDLLGNEQHLLDDLAPWDQSRLLAWRSRSNCDRCFNARQYEKIGLLEHHPERFWDAVQIEENTGAAGYSWHVSYSLRELVPRADEIKERRAKQVLKYLLNQKQKMLFEPDDKLYDALAVTSCGLLCGK